MSIEVWLAFVAASTVLLIIPGPTVVLVMSYAVSQGRRVAVASAAGVALGDLLAMVVALAGYSLVFEISDTLIFIVKWVGAAYLVFLGCQLLFGVTSSSQIDEKRAHTPLSVVFFHSTAVTAFNPKSLLFFVAFVPQFFVADSEFSVITQSTILVITFVMLAAINALTYALFADLLIGKSGHSKASLWFARLGGVTLITIGIAIAFQFVA